MNRSIDRSVHIKRVMRFNEDGTAGSVAPRIPRPQPKGLKARYQPLGAPAAPMGKIGVDTSSDSEEDVQMGDAPLPLPSSETPKIANKKRKHGAVGNGTPSQDGPGSASAKKSKKARVEAAAGSKSTSKDSSSLKKQTPIPPPPVPSSNGKATLPASSPDLSTRKAQAPSPDKLPSTQPATSTKVPKKVTPVVPPRFSGSNN